MCGMARHGYFSLKGLSMNFQIDTTGLIAGDVIDQMTCETIIGFKEVDDPKAWALQILQLSGQVGTQLKKEHGRELTIRIHDNALNILTDQQAAEYNPKRFDSGLRQARRAHRRLMAVDVSKLDATTLGYYSKNVTNQAFKLSMLRKKEAAELPVSQRQTPFVLKKPT